MDFFKAMDLMQSGEKVRIKSWPKGAYIGVIEEKKKIFGKNVTQYTPVREDQQEYNMPVSMVALLQADWQIHESDDDDFGEDED